MKVYGYKLTDGQINACAARTSQPFTALDIQRAAERAGVPSAGAVSMRAADRLLQRWKASHVIAFDVEVRKWQRI